MLIFVATFKRNMARILAFDYGTVRTGIAVTDPMQIIASGLATVSTKEIFKFITEYLQSEPVELFVVGQPKQMDYTDSQSADAIAIFISKLNATYSKIPVVKVDERFTSKMAFDTMLSSGLKKKQRQNKGLIDEISATIILQTYLDQKPI